MLIREVHSVPLRRLQFTFSSVVAVPCRGLSEILVAPWPAMDVTRRLSTSIPAGKKPELLGLSESTFMNPVVESTKFAYRVCPIPSLNITTF